MSPTQQSACCTVSNSTCECIVMRDIRTGILYVLGMFSVLGHQSHRSRFGLESHWFLFDKVHSVVSTIFSSSFSRCDNFSSNTSNTVVWVSAELPLISTWSRVIYGRSYKLSSLQIFDACNSCVFNAQPKHFGIHLQAQLIVRIDSQIEVLSWSNDTWARVSVKFLYQGEVVHDTPINLLESCRKLNSDQSRETQQAWYKGSNMQIAFEEAHSWLEECSGQLIFFRIS